MATKKKVEEAKVEVKEAAQKAAAGAKKTAATAAKKTATAAKKTATAAKKTASAAKKTVAAKKPAEKKVVTVVEFAEKQVDVENVVEACKADFKANNKGNVRTINVYIKPEDNAAYYVVNGKVNGKVDL